jgi:hypothetical protein
LVYAVSSWQTAERRQPEPANEHPATLPPVENGSAETGPNPAAPVVPEPAAAPPAVNLPAAKPVVKPKPVAPPPSSDAPPAAPVESAAARPTQPAPPPVNLPTVLARLDAHASGNGAPAEGGAPLTLTIEATDAGWVAARIDGNELKEVYLEPGEKVTWRAADGFVLSLGNAGGVKVHLNGKPLGPLGSKGAVVKNVQIN